MGLLVGWLALRAGAGQESIRLFAAVGVLGGFTTFSAFSLEAALMIERREIVSAFVYAASSVVLAIAALREVQTLYVAEDEDDIRLDRWFKRRWPHLTHIQVEKMARSGQIRVDGSRVKPQDRLTAGA
ncbi:hypothetical protein LTR94_032508, partial [Friedmanniomyces endolithicus]